MSEMAEHEHPRPVELEDVPDDEQISTADAAQRIDEDPDDQPNRRDPVWDDEGHED